MIAGPVMIDLACKDLVEAVRMALGKIVVRVAAVRGEVMITAPINRITEVLRALRDHPATDFHQLMDVCGVDYPDRRPRFDVAYQLLSLSRNWRLTVIVQVIEEASVPSVVSVYPSAGWFEREVFDLFGIPFTGHPDLRRILTDYGFEGHPLRKDFPLTGHVQVRYDDLQRKVVQEPVQLEQDFRAFDASSRWQGITDVQRRDENE